MTDGPWAPLATYRLQFNQDFRLADAQTLVSYFSRLGVTHLYASPLLRARQASTHGYDVVDPLAVNPRLGNMADLISLVTELRKLGLGLILDIVPNHMAASIENPYWRDVLTYGPNSPFARWFDIDWRLPDPDMWGRVLAPALGDHRSRVLEADQIRLVWSDGRFLLRYFDHDFPVDPATVPSICIYGWADLVQQLEPDSPTLHKMSDILIRLKELPKLVLRLRKQVNLDREQTEAWLAEFAQLVVHSPTIQAWAERTAAGFTQGVEGRRRLRKLLDCQPYRLVYWREAARRINYRRFFDINDLVSLRQEDPQVFEATHTVILRLVDDNLLDGVRIDHIDGLRDPLGYLRRLSEAFAAHARTGRTLPIFVEKILAPHEKLPRDWPVAGTTGYEFLNQAEAVFVSPSGYAAIEQWYRLILGQRNDFADLAIRGKRRVLHADLAPQVGRLADTLWRLREDAVCRLTARSKPEAASLAEPDAGAAPEPSDVVTRDLPTGVATTATSTAMAATSAAATAAADNSAAPASGLANLTRRELTTAIVEVAAALPIYRTYVDATSSTVGEVDRAHVQAALDAARAAGRARPEALAFLGDVLQLEDSATTSERDRAQRVNFIQRFQQLTSPAAAKGIEDTAFYAYVPLGSLNEVGGEPRLASTDPVADLHAANAERAAAWPWTMLCVTTHDTKRTADVRARLDVLSELPETWIDWATRWRRAHRGHQTLVGGKKTPDAADQYLFYQTLVGLWPAPDHEHPSRLPADTELADLRERIDAYMIKAAREAKRHTSWTRQNRGYEQALRAFVGQALPSAAADSPFLADVQQLVARIARPGFWNSLSRTLIQFTAPGTPDLYQGDEVWNFALVDPDNRRPIDYQQRRLLLDEVITGSEGSEDSRNEFVESLVQSPEDGRIKLHLIHCALAARRNHPEIFAASEYLPLEVRGPGQDHIVAFARVAARQHASEPVEAEREHAALVVVPRLTTGLRSAPFDPPIGTDVWSETALILPDALRRRGWTNRLTRQQLAPPGGASLPIAQLLSAFPAALLVSEP